MRIVALATLCSLLAGASLASSPALAQQKTAKTCQDEWRAHRADNQKDGITEKEYVDKCRPAGAVGSPAPNAAAAKPAAVPEPGAKARVRPTTPAGFNAEAQAKARCPSDTIVWANLDSKIYHFSGHKDYGTTKNGAFLCEKDATALESVRRRTKSTHRGFVHAA